MTHQLRFVRSLSILIPLAMGLSLALSASAWAVGKGQLDTSFGSGGVASTGSNSRLLGTAVQPDGKIVAVGASGVGSSLNLLVARYTTSGARDSTFSGGVVTGTANVLGQGVTIQPDGKIVVVGTATDSSGTSNQGIVVERFNTNGSLDTSFGSGGSVVTQTGAGKGQGNAVAIDKGEIVVTGDGSIVNGAPQNQGYPGVAIVRISSGGHVDTSTVYDLGRFSIGTGVAVQPDGRFVVGGTQRNDLRTTQTLAARFNADGSQDASFAGGLFLQQYASNAGYSGFNSVALQPDGKVVLAGTALSSTTGVNALFVRLTSSGGLDGSFGSGGAAQLPASNNAQAAQTESPPYAALGVAVSGGEIFATGWYSKSSVRNLAVWGVTSSGSPDTSFGSGGTTLIANPSSMLQGNGIAVAPDGSLLVAGEADAFFPRTPTGIELRFGGGGGPTPGKLVATATTKSPYKRSVVRKQGIGGIVVGCNRACSFKATLIAPPKVAAALGIGRTIKHCRKVHGKRRCTITHTQGTLITVRGTLGSAGQKTLTLNNALIRRAANKFARLSLPLTIAFTSQKGNANLKRTIIVK